jgi:hypothetical protein
VSTWTDFPLPPLPGDPPLSESDLFARLKALGAAVWTLPDPLQREYAKGLWIDYLVRVPTLGTGTTSRAAQVVEAAATLGRSTTTAAGFQYYTVEALRSLPKPEGLVHGILDRGALVTTYGPSGIGKTFVALGCSLSVATGTAWHGHAVHAGPVLYVAGEGIGHLAQRIDAWALEHGYTTTDPIPNFRVLLRPVPVLEPQAIAMLVQDLTAWEPRPVLITLDTLALCLAGGDENSTSDMSRAVDALRTIRDATGATVHVIHHTGWNETGRERGSGALRGAMDLTMALKQEGGELVLSCEKPRDRLPWEPLRFQLVPSGESVVPRAIMAGRASTLPPTAQSALDALVDITTRPGEWVEFGRWKAASCANGAFAQKAQMPPRTFYHAVRVLNECNLIDDDGEGRQRKVRHRVSDNVGV